jgi:hypothetical protein
MDRGTSYKKFYSITRVGIKMLIEAENHFAGLPTYAKEKRKRSDAGSHIIIQNINSFFLSLFLCFVSTQFSDMLL